MPAFSPFFINANFCYSQQDCRSLDVFMDRVAGNTGNSYIAYAIFKIVFGKTVRVPGINNLWSWDFADEDALAEQINRQHSHVFFCLQDQIRLSLSYGVKPDWARLNRFLLKLKKPFVVFSLGANAFPGDPEDWYRRLQPEFVRFLNILSEEAVSLGVRGEETLEILRKLGISNAYAAGCPTFFETGANRRVEKRPLASSARHLDGEGLFVLQDERDLISVLYFPQEASALRTHISPVGLARLAAGQVPCFASMEEWKRYVSGFAFNVSRRVHGGILSLNAGVPAIVTNDDLRSREMCALFGIPRRPEAAERKDWRTVYEETDFEPLNQKYPVLHARFMNWLADNGVGAAELEQARQWAQTQEDLVPPHLEFHSEKVAELLNRFEFYIPSGVLLHKLLEKRLPFLLPFLGKK